MATMRQTSLSSMRRRTCASPSSLARSARYGSSQRLTPSHPHLLTSSPHHTTSPPLLTTSLPLLISSLQVKLPVAAAADDTMLAAMSAPDMPNKDFAAAYEAQKYGFKRGWAASIPGGRNIMAGFKTVVGGVGGALDSARSVTNQLAKNSKKEEESRQKEESKAGEAKSPRPVEVK